MRTACSCDPSGHLGSSLAWDLSPGLRSCRRLTGVTHTSAPSGLCMKKSL